MSQPGLCPAHPTAIPSVATPRLVLGLVVAYAVAATALYPLATQAGPELPGITPFFVGGLVVTDFSVAFLLFVRCRTARSRPLLILGGAYLFSGLMACCHLLTFPGAILAGRPLLGGGQSAAWVFMGWMAGFAGLTLAAIIAEAVGGRPIRPSRAMPAAMLAACALAAGVMLAALQPDGRLPDLIQGGSFTTLDDAISLATLALLAIGMVIVPLRLRRRDGLFHWLALALTALFAASVLSLAGGARYTIGWLVSRLGWVISSALLFLFFLREFAQQQRQLVAARDELEQRVAERTIELARLDTQRELLLREVYHRVKNNLQVVDSLIALESLRITDPAARAAFADLRNRVIALGLVHQQLMLSDNLETFSLATFLHDLAENVAASFSCAERGITVSVAVEPVVVNLDFAIPVGLLTTELLSNAIKRTGTTSVTVHFDSLPDGEGCLVVEDDGTADIVAATDVTKRPGTGGRIILGLVGQLDGRMLIVEQPGTRVEISMKLSAMA
jgi:two-component sensor histidine kinase